MSPKLASPNFVMFYVFRFIYVNCPRGNQDKISCLKLGVDELVADSIALPASNGITICHLNMVSLVKNIEKLEEFLNEFSRKPEIICISETRTNDKNIHSVVLPRYSFNSDNSSTKAGEVGIYVVDSFYCQEITNLRLNQLGCEDVWIEVNLNDKTNLVVGTVYRHPQPNYLKFSQAF